MTREWPTEVENFLTLDIDQQADLLLWGIYHARANEQGKNFIHFRLGEWFPDLAGIAGLPSNVPARQRQREEATDALENAYSRLMSQGLIRPDSRSGSTFCKVTPDGEAQVQAANFPTPRV